MILTFDQLREYRGQVAMVDGAFDPLHDGHIEYFRQAAALGVPVLCNVAGDEYVEQKHPPLIPAAQRAAIIDAIRYVTYTHLSHTTTAAVLEELRPRMFVKGADWRGRLPAEEEDACRCHGVEMVFLDSVIESSSRLLRVYPWGRPADVGVSAFEAVVFSQRVVDPERYDRAYFVDAWRTDGGQYTIEHRRQVEGRHPTLIKETFAPVKVLDVGCGPGLLMLFLQEVGVLADGIDVSPVSRELAPAEVRDRIQIGSIVELPVAEGAYDLVICREVLEHLTMLQIRRAVASTVRASSRFVYVTTRFHPDPSHLLAVVTQFDVDPTHITLLHKEFLRVLFILEGCRSRPDLETRMDWQNKGRVLVMEKVKDSLV